jgi:hypothetical protein
MNNIHMIHSSDRRTICRELEALEVTTAHFSNGAYTHDAETVVPTLLAGFKKVTELEGNLPLVVAMNSDLSLTNAGKTTQKSQQERADMVATPLAQLFPDTKIIILFFDEDTPNALYQSLANEKLTHSLHKWGFGINPQAPKIEGAELFQKTYAFPLPQDDKPLAVFHHDTKAPDEPQEVGVFDLQGTHLALENLEEERQKRWFTLFQHPEEQKALTERPAKEIKKQRRVILFDLPEELKSYRPREKQASLLDSCTIC